MYPNENPSELLPDEYDLEGLNDDSPSKPFYKGCLIVIATLLILSLLAKSGRSRTVIPGHAAHSFQSMSHSESGVSRTL